MVYLLSQSKTLWLGGPKLIHVSGKIIISYSTTTLVGLISVKNPVKSNFTQVHSSKDEPKADIHPPLFIN